MNQSQQQHPSFEAEPGLKFVSLRGSVPTDFMNPYLELEKAEKEKALDQALALLSEKNRELIDLRFGFEGEAKTQASAARTMGVSRQNAHQMEIRALSALGKSLGPDLTEQGIDQQVREATPIVISPDPEKRRQAKHLGYEVYGTGLIELLRGLAKVSPSEGQSHIIRDDKDTQKTLLLEKLSGIKIPRDLSGLSQTEKRILASDIIKVILKRAGRQEKPCPKTN